MLAIHDFSYRISSDITDTTSLFRPYFIDDERVIISTSTAGQPSQGSEVKKVTVLSPHPGSELCSANFDKYLPWSMGLYTPYPFGYPSQLPLGVYSRSHATWRHGLQICPHRYPLCSWVERSNAA